jgi:transcriptional regulator with XRE-family HTH domain
MISISSMNDMAPPAGIAYIGDENAAEWAGSNQREVAMPIGERIKTLRAERRWSQGDLAAKISADPGQISRYENGHIAPSADAIVRLAEALDVSCDYLLIDDAPRRVFRSPIEDALGGSLSAVTELGDEDLHSVQNFVDALITRARLKALAGGSA